MREVERQLLEIEKELVRPLEELAFNDAALYKETKKMKDVSPARSGTTKAGHCSSPSGKRNHAKRPLVNCVHASLFEISTSLRTTTRLRC